MVSLPARTPSLATPTLALLLALGGCFKADDVGDDELGESGTDSSGTDSTGTDSTDDASTSETDGPQPQPPSIDVFTVAGSESPAEITAAGAVAIVVEASDPDGEVALVELLRDGEVFASIPAPGPYVGEFLIGGEDFDGSYDFTARAVDDDDLEATAGPIALDVNVPNGGVVETFTLDGGEDDLLYRVWAGPEGNQVVGVGASNSAGMSLIRADRLVGPPWMDKVGMINSFGSGIVGLPSGEFAAVTWNNVESVYMRFGVGGGLLSTDVSNWPPANVPPEQFEAPLDIAADAEGNTYTTGIFATGLDYDAFMLRQHDDAGAVGWTVYGINPMTYPIPPYALRLDVAADTVLVGGQLRQADPSINRPWFARFSTQGGLLGQVEPVDFDGLVWATGIDELGNVIVGGIHLTDGGGIPWAARYDADDQQVWFGEDMASEGLVFAADLDPFGDTIVAAVIDCDGGFVFSTGCDLVVRKHDENGVLVWEQIFDDDGFTGPGLVPLAGDIHFDRFGYAYVGLSHLGPNMNLDWWITKFNP
jgi:hypothetical protein